MNEDTTIGNGNARSVSLHGLAKRFGEVTAVHPLDLEVDAGELLVLLGPSGCGKSTILRMIAGVEDPSAGEVRIGEEIVNDREPAERDVAMVFQNYALYPQMTVRDNLSFPLRMRRMRVTAMRERVQWAADLLELDLLLDRRPGQLSGGQRQRVALGRALVREPAVFLFDEPLSNLDARLRLEMRDLIASLHSRLGATMIFVTHDQVEAMSLGERIAVLRQGRIQQIGPPLEVYARPDNLFVARFIGSPPINSVEGELENEDGDAVFVAPNVRLPGARREASSRDGGRAILAVRPEALRFVEPGSSAADLRGRVQRIEPLGSEVLVHVDAGMVDATPWVARIAPHTNVHAGDTVGIAIDRDRAHLFDGSNGARIGFLGRRSETG